MCRIYTEIVRKPEISMQTPNLALYFSFGKI